MRRSHSSRRPAARLGWALLATALLSMVCPTPAAAEPRFNVAEARKSVVFIKRITPGLGPAVGSGFLASKDGLVYTNRHVALPADEGIRGSILLVGVPSAKDPEVLDFYRAEVVYVPGAGENLDFAVLKIAARKDQPGFVPLPLSFDRLELASDVAVLGYPHVQDNQPHLAFNKGSVSATRVRIEDRSYYQTDAAVNPGNSGGPLLNTKGEAVGIVTRRKGNADNIGFALHLSEVKAAAEQARARAARVKAEPGPLDPKNLPVVASVAPKRGNWEVAEGTLREEKGFLVLDNNGGTYSVTSKEPLPEDFQLVLQCRIEFLRGNQRLQPSQRSILRTLVVRFATPDTKAMILERKGNLVRFSHELLLLYKEGEPDAVKAEWKGNPEDPFVLVITKQGGDYSVAVDGEILMRYHDAKPLKGGHRFCIGGYLSRLYLGEVSVIDLGGGKGLTPANAPAAHPHAEALQKQAASWLRENNAFGPNDRIVTDLGGAAEEALRQGRNFALVLAPDLMKSGKATVAASWGDQLFAFELTDEQRKRTGLKPGEASVRRGSLVNDKVQAPAPVRISDLNVEGGPQVDGSKDLKVRLTCEPKVKVAGEVAVRLSYSANGSTTQLFHYLDAPPEKGTITAAYRAINDGRRENVLGPVVAFCDVCVVRQVGEDMEVTVVSNPVAILLDVR